MSKKISKRTRHEILFDSAVRITNHECEKTKKGIDTISNELIYFAGLVKKYEIVLEKICQLENDGDEWKGVDLFHKVQKLAWKALKERVDL